mgnify:CR=1 FL=1
MYAKFEKIYHQEVTQKLIARFETDRETNRDDELIKALVKNRTNLWSATGSTLVFHEDYYINLKTPDFKDYKQLFKTNKGKNKFFNTNFFNWIMYCHPI